MKRYIKLTNLLLIFFLLPLSFCFSATYNYDSLNRLSSITYDDGSQITYTYDSVGNRISESRNASTPGLTSMNPNSGNTNSIITTQIFGNSFQIGNTPYLIFGTSTVSGTILTISNPTTMTVTFDLAGIINGSSGDLRVVNPDTKSTLLPGAFGAVPIELSQFEAIIEDKE